MAFAFDTLGYTKKLRASGISQDQAEAHAEAAREFIMAELVTRNDLDVLRRELEGRIDKLEMKIETQTLRLTVRLGGMLVVAVGALAALLKLT